MKPSATRDTTISDDSAVPPRPEAESPVAVARRSRPRWRWVALVILAVAAVAGWFGHDRYRVARLADSVRRAFATQRYDEAREPLRRWLGERPRSAEAHYYRAWLALVDDRPGDAVEAARRASELGFDRWSLEILQAIFRSRGGHINDVEPVLRRAYDEGREPRVEVARELARVYLATYRLTQAVAVVERYRELRPSDPQAYMWLNEIGSRTGALPAVMIRNYRAALERDPELDKARLGLAEQLSKDRRFDEAEEEYRAYLRRHPRDASVLVGLGRNAFQNGDIDAATRAYEEALEVDPRQADAIKELAQLDKRYGRFDRACRRLERLTQIEPFDHEVRYSYAQALQLAGRAEEARAESERAASLRSEYDRVAQLRSRILGDPTDLASRSEVARWMLTHGHDHEGLEWTREILRADPRHGPTHRLLADYYSQHGNPGLANYHRAMALSGSDAR